MCGDSGKTGLLNCILAIYDCLNDGVGREHIVLTVTPEGFGTHGASADQLYKAIRINEISVTTLTGPLCRLLLEGDREAKMPTKGDNTQLQSMKTKQHAITFMTSNLPDLATFKQVLKETGIKGTWTSSDYARNLSMDGGRVGGFFRSECKIPAIIRRELYTCPYCGARLIRWSIKTFLLSKNDRTVQTKEDIWKDSDDESENTYEGITEYSDFWEVMKIDPDLLNHMIEEEAIQRAAKGSQTISLEGEELEAYLDFKQHQAELRLARRLSVESSSTTIEKSRETPLKEAVTAESK